jgi:hypothetical protein
VTQNALLSTFEEATGEKWTVTHESSEEFYARPKKSQAAGDHGMTRFMSLMTANMFEDNSGREITTPNDDWDNELLGVPREDVLTIANGILAFW